MARAHTRLEKEGLHVEIDWHPDDPVVIGGSDESKKRFEELRSEEYVKGDPAGDDPRP